MTVRSTSMEAYKEIKDKGLLGPKQFEVYQVLVDAGPLTANEIFKRVIGQSGINQANVPARLNELRRMGCVKEVGQGVCSVTGRKVLVWEVTKNLPTPISRALKNVCPTCYGTGEVR